MNLYLLQFALMCTLQARSIKGWGGAPFLAANLFLKFTYRKLNFKGAPSPNFWGHEQNYRDIQMQIKMFGSMHPLSHRLEFLKIGREILVRKLILACLDF